MLAKDPKLMAKLMESVAVIKVAVSCKKTELMSLHKDHDEPFRTFAAFVRNKAETCDFYTVS